MTHNIGTKDRPIALKTPSQNASYTAHIAEKDGCEILVCTVGKTVIHYSASAIEDLHAMLLEHGDWMELGSTDEQKPARAGTVEAWARAATNPTGGWYGLRKGFRGRFAMYVPPLLEALGLAELTHEPKGNRMRALPGVEP